MIRRPPRVTRTDTLFADRTPVRSIAVAGGMIAGVMAVVGMVILIYRRRTVGPVFSATTVMDKVMYAFLAAAIVLGMWNTIAGSIMTVGGERSEEHTSALQSLMRISYAVFCLKNTQNTHTQVL